MNLRKKKKAITKILWAFILFNTYSCSSQHCSNLYEKVKKDYEKGSYHINLKEIFDFNWDSLFILDDYINKDDFKESTGLDFDFERVADSHSKYIFVLNNKIIKTSVEWCSGYGFRVNYLKGGGIVKIDAKNSRFTILKKENYYTLVPYKKN